MAKKQTTPAQFKLLVDFMSAHPDIGRGASQRRPEEQNRLWDEVSNKLNACSLPKRDVPGWKKVWRDYKANTKKKMIINKQYMEGTGGGPNKTIPLNDLEEVVASLLSYNTSVSGMPKKQFGVSEEPVAKENILSFEEETNLEDELDESNVQQQVPTKKQKMNQSNLLQQQIELQQAFFENYNSLKKEELGYLKTIAQGLTTLANQNV